jgi:hypothetical protein
VISNNNKTDDLYLYALLLGSLIIVPMRIVPICTVINAISVIVCVYIRTIQSKGISIEMNVSRNMREKWSKLSLYNEVVIKLAVYVWTLLWTRNYRLKGVLVS